MSEEHTPLHEHVGAGTEEHEGLGGLGLGPAEPRGHRGRRGHRARRRGKGTAFSCLVVLVVLAVIGVGAFLGLTRGMDWVKDQFAEPADYAGPGTGSVLIEVKSGENASDIARTLEEKDVVASVEAFIAVATARNDEASRIQVGFYELQLKMKAADALTLLADPANLSQSVVTIPEGMRVVDVVARLAEKTGLPKEQFQAAVQNTAALGLPEYAGGKLEGYLFPATYTFAPSDTPDTMIRAMVDRWRQAAEEVGLEEAALALGYTPAELMTIASLVEAEGRGDDMPKIARVIYNRLTTKGAPTFGRLEIDATVNYAHGRNLGVALTTADLAIDSPYNTRKYPGLPPTPIEAPGLEAMKAATNPAEGDWLFYVTVNLATGETRFARTYDEFLTYKKELQEYCRTESERC